jgi:Fur family transcriptional regulator, ferric uptake regulator
MTEAGNLRATLRRAGQRITPQRLLVLSILAEHGGHITAEEILEKAQAIYPYLNLSTVYRTLGLLVEHGLATETDLCGGVRHFELLGHEPHHHLVCQECGDVQEIGDVLLQPLREQILAHHGFDARMDHFAIFGICHHCQADLASD